MAELVVSEAQAVVVRKNDGIEVTIEDRRAETLRLFEPVPEEQLGALAADAWKIGLRALTVAMAQAEQATLEDAGNRLVKDVDTRVRHLLEMQGKEMVTTLKSYFDPEDGHLKTRLSSITDPDGDLARLLQAHVALDGSSLAKTLAAQVGAESPLLKRLSATDSEGVIQQLEAKFLMALEGHKVELSKALDPQAEEGPVRRFLVDLHERLMKAGADQEKMVREVTKALDANDDNSLLNRLNRDVQTANKELLKAVNPDDPTSPMASVRTTLEKLIKSHMEANKELLEKAQKDQAAFQKDMRDAITRIEKQKEADDRSTFGGFAFEDAVTTFVGHALNGGPYAVEATGNTTGIVRNSKKGDQVVRFMAEHAFSESGLVIESKRDSSYTVVRALEEMEEARNNRNCQAGLFVMNATSAPNGFPRFARYGPDILVTWNPEDGTTDSYLHAAVLAALSLVTKSAKRDNQGNIAALHDIGQRVSAEVERLTKMETWTGNIARDATKIEDEIRKAKSKLDVLNRKGREVLAELYEVMADEAEFRHDPITAPEDGLERAREALGRSHAPDADVAEGSMRASIGMPVATAARRAGDNDEEE